MMNGKLKDNGFLRGAFWLTASAIILKMIGVIYKIPLSYLLGDEGMGYFNSAYTVYIFFYIIGSAGIPKAISILVSKYEAEDEKISDDIFLSAFKILILFGVVLSVLFLSLSRALSHAFGASNSFYSMLAVAPSIFFVTAGGALRGYLSGKMRFAPVAVSELISGIAKLLLGLLFAFLGIRAGYSLNVICALAILGISIGSFLGMIYLLFICRKVCTSDVGAKRRNFKYVGEIINIAAPITFAAAMGSVVNIFDLTMILNGLKEQNYSDLAATVLYGNYTTLTVPMLGLVTTLINPIGASLQPVLTKAYSLGNKKAASDAIETACELVSFISFPSFTAFFFFPTEILSIIFERESAVLAAPTLAAIAPSLLFFGTLTIINTALEAAQRVRATMLSLSIGAVFKLIFSIVFMHRADLGILSAPLGTAISYMVSFLISYFIFANRFKIRLPLFKCGFKYFFISLLCALPIIIYRNNTMPLLNKRSTDIVILALFAAIYLTISLFFSKKIKNYLAFLVKSHKRS